MKPVVSVIIPCYNVEKYVKKCVTSIICQTYGNIEVICINDGSTDDTLSMLKDFAKNDVRIKLYDQENKGLSETRTLGIQYSTGDYIIFVDSDDWIELNCIETLMQIKKNYDVVCFSYMREFKGQSLPKKLGLSGEFTAEEIQRRIVGPVGEELAQVENLDALVTVWGKLYRSNNIKELHFEEVSKIGTWEDGLFNLNVLENCGEVLVIDKPLYHYRKSNQTSFTSQYRKNLYKKWMVKFSLISNISQNKDGLFKKALQNRIAISTLGLLLTEVNNSNTMTQKLKGIRQILSEKVYHNALQNLDTSEMGLQWKIFYTFAKYKFVFGAFVLTQSIILIINRKN